MFDLNRHAHGVNLKASGIWKMGAGSRGENEMYGENESGFKKVGHIN